LISFALYLLTRYMVISFFISGIFETAATGNAVCTELSRTWLVIFAVAVLFSFIAGELTRNYSQTDKLWSLMPMIYGWSAVIFCPSPRLLLMASLVTVWGLRLTYNFYRKGGYSIIPWLGEEDYRWKILREYPLLKGRLRFGLFNFFFISFYQHLLILLFSSPFLVAAVYCDDKIEEIDIISAFLMLLFIIVETIADNQQYRFQMFKKGLTSKGDEFAVSLRKGFLTEGIWSYVRHPNYTAEQAIWICFYFFGVAASGKWLNWTLAGPVLLVLLFQGSARLTEKISSSKYPEYSEYQKNVPRFLPRLCRKKP